MMRPGFHTVTPYIVLRDTDKAIEFYRTAFNAELIHRQADGDGRVRHAEIRVGDSPIMLCGEFSEFSKIMKSVESHGGSPVHLFLYVDDPDSWFRRALEAGASLTMPVEDHSYGRGGGVTDPFGLTWWINSHKES